MLLLAVETTGQQGSLALARASGEEFKMLEVAALAAGEYSAQLVPTLAAMLQRQGAGKRDIGGLAAASGPGSFTGLRVGLSAVKALAEVLGAPLAAVSMLQALAAAGEQAGDGVILALADAGRGEVYCGEYEAGGALPAGRGEILVKREQLLAGLAEQATVVTADEPLRAWLASAGREARLVARPRADLIARLGWKKLQAGQSVSAAELDANYIRRSDAELFSPARPGPKR